MNYLDNINTQFSYYNENIINGCNITVKDSNNIFNSYHYINDTNKQVLADSYSHYPIICADAQIPATPWVSEQYILDNNIDIGFPAIGSIPNFLGSPSLTHPLLIPNTIISLTLPPGQNNWLPIGRWLGKTIFMRCYSS
jgi:hypothetical protein